MGSAEFGYVANPHPTHIELTPTAEYDALVSEWLTWSQMRRQLGLGQVSLADYMSNNQTKDS